MTIIASGRCPEGRSRIRGVPPRPLLASGQSECRLVERVPDQEVAQLAMWKNREMVQQMHGDLVVARDAAEGASFRLTLPLAQPLA